MIETKILPYGDEMDKPLNEVKIFIVWYKYNIFTTWKQVPLYLKGSFEECSDLEHRIWAGEYLPPDPWYKHIPKTIWKYMYSTWMCVRFPFLYPRNRWSGKHYNNWNILSKMGEYYRKAYKLETVDVGGEQHIKIRCINLKYAIYRYVLKIYHTILEFIHFPTSYTELDQFKYNMPGWYNAFGMKFLKELRWQLIKDGYLFRYRITDWKEKYGVMEMYNNGASDKVWNIIRKYRELSYSTCIKCGKSAKYITCGWICSYCEEHLPEYNRKSRKYHDINEIENEEDYED